MLKHLPYTCSTAAGTEPDYTHLKVFCLIATAADDAQHPIIQQLYSDMDASTKLPAGDCQAGTASVVVGSLDLNQGAVLPAEEMVGRQPEVRGGCQQGLPFIP